MLQLVIPENEWFDELTSTFTYTKRVELKLEHSLVSISKWEAKWCKPFLTKDKKTLEEERDYVRCMTITQNVDPEIFKTLPSSIIGEVDEYINAPMTATWFGSQSQSGGSRDIITSEVLYYLMIAHNIPMECQKWHLNRLITLIQVCNIKNQPEKKQPRKDVVSQRRALNEARKAKLKTKG